MTARRGLRHAAFFEALATQDPAGPSWRATSAGLVTLRLVDRWTWVRDDGCAVPVEAVRAVRRAVHRVEAHEVNEVLVLAEAAQGALAREDPLPSDSPVEAPGVLAPVILALSAL
jgi:hypothetical protein